MKDLFSFAVFFILIFAHPEICCGMELPKELRGVWAVDITASEDHIRKNIFNGTDDDKYELAFVKMAALENRLFFDISEDTIQLAGLQLTRQLFAESEKSLMLAALKRNSHLPSVCFPKKVDRVGDSWEVELFGVYGALKFIVENERVLFRHNSLYGSDLVLKKIRNYEEFTPVEHRGTWAVDLPLTIEAWGADEKLGSKELLSLIQNRISGLAIRISNREFEFQANEKLWLGFFAKEKGTSKAERRIRFKSGSEGILNFSGRGILTFSLGTETPGPISFRRLPFNQNLHSSRSLKCLEGDWEVDQQANRQFYKKLILFDYEKEKLMSQASDIINRQFKIKLTFEDAKLLVEAAGIEYSQNRLWYQQKGINSFHLHCAKTEEVDSPFNDFDLKLVGKDLIAIQVFEAPEVIMRSSTSGKGD